MSEESDKGVSVDEDPVAKSHAYAHSINIPSVATGTSSFHGWNSERDNRNFAHLIAPMESIRKLVNSHLIGLEFGMKVYNPQGKFIRIWNRIFLLSCAVAVIIDALFLYIPVIDGKKNCLALDEELKLTLCVIRSFADIIYVLYIFFQFRTGIVSPSCGFGTGVLEEDAVVIAQQYLLSYFLIDILAVLPLPQVVILKTSSLWRHFVHWNMRSLLRYVVFFQYIPRLLRIIPLYKKVRRATIITGTGWMGIAFNFFLYVLAGHIFGAFWYLLAIERKFTCQLEACRTTTKCHVDLLYCGNHNTGGKAYLDASCPVIEPNATKFDFGIYLDALHSGVVESKDFGQKLIYCFWWGIQNLGSLGQNLKASTFHPEVLFAVSVSTCGLLLFILFVGNIQMYLMSHTISTEKEVRSKLKNVERWMAHIALPEEMRYRVRQFEQYKWEKTRGFDDENLLQNLPKDLSRDIKRHQRLPLLMRVPLFQDMDRQLIDAMCDRLKPALYIKNSFIYEEGNHVGEMLFIMSGTLLSTTKDGGRTGVFNSVKLKAGDFCGEELLSWALYHPSSFQNFPVSTRTVKTETEVEAFFLAADDLKHFGSQFRSLHGKQLQHTFRFYSHQWRTWAASFIQASWLRYRKKRSQGSQLEDLNTSRASGIKRTSSVVQYRSLRKRPSNSIPKPMEPKFSDE